MEWKKFMTEIDFETLISEISDGLDRALSGMVCENFRDVDEAEEEAKQNIIREIRVAFDKVEAIAEIEERFRTLQQEMLQLQSRIGDLIRESRVKNI